MGNIFHFVKFNRLFLCGTLITFSLVSLPNPCYSQTPRVVTINDLAFAHRIEKLLEKVKRAAEKNDGNKLIDLMLDVKREVETYSGMKIDLDKQLDVVESEIKKKGAKIPKNEFKELRKIIKKKEKRAGHRAAYLELCLLNPEISYNLEEEQLLFDATHGHEKKEEAEMVVPIRLTVGVTVALVGLCLIVVPGIPVQIKTWGKDMIVYGTGIAAEACYSAHDKSKNK